MHLQLPSRFLQSKESVDGPVGVDRPHAPFDIVPVSVSERRHVSVVVLIRFRRPAKIVGFVVGWVAV